MGDGGTAGTGGHREGGGDDDPDRGREHIEVLKETIDRNRGLGWEDYRERYRFVVVDDGRIRLSPTDRKSTPGRALERGVDHVVEVEGGRRRRLQLLRGTAPIRPETVQTHACGRRPPAPVSVRATPSNVSESERRQGSTGTPSR